jgi:uncharacterized protein with HEPN domain
MTRHSDDISMRQMLDYSREIRTAVEGQTKKQAFSDRFRELALMKLFEMIGEAANRVSNQTKEQYPQIPWRPIIGARNRLSHGYDRIDHEVVWDAATNHIPVLIEQLEEILGEKQ